MGRIFKPARMPYGDAPHILRTKYKTAETWLAGALMQFDVNGELIECPADPVAGSGGVAGVATAANDSGLGYAMANNPTVVTGRSQEVSIYVADRVTIFSGRMVNGGTDPVTPAQTDIDTKYGVAAVAGEWVVDQADTTNVVVEIVDIDVGEKIVFFKFLEAVINLP